MPRVSTIRIAVQMAGSSEPENYRVDEGMTYREFLEDDVQVNLSKFDVFVNGSPADLDDEVQPGDNIQLQTKKYSSGC